MEASQFHHPYPFDQSLLNPSPTSTAASTTSIGFSDEFHQPHDQIIPNAFIVNAHSNQVTICNNLQSSDCPPSMEGGTKKTCKKWRKQNKSNSDQENEKKARDCKEGQIGYVYVRARRGEATDSHSLAERVRREKISEKMKALQAIVPGCDKITGKALMLEEVINYVQSLQNEIQFLSSKLACVDHMYGSGLEFNAAMLNSHQSVTTNEQLSFQEHQMSIMDFENNGDIVWNMDEQGQGHEDPFATINSFNSFY